jgi:ribosome modulation factor
MPNFEVSRRINLLQVNKRGVIFQQITLQYRQGLGTDHLCCPFYKETTSRSDFVVALENLLALTRAHRQGYKLFCGVR